MYSIRLQYLRLFLLVVCIVIPRHKHIVATPSMRYVTTIPLNLQQSIIPGNPVTSIVDASANPAFAPDEGRISLTSTSRCVCYLLLRFGC